jgi:Protein of unknown function (DUF2846)
MNEVISKILLLALAFMLGGCTAPNYKSATNVPSDKALVYLYRTYNYIGSGAGHKIYANQKPITLLYTRNYYPYVADPGNITFTVKEVMVGEMGLFNFVIPQTQAAQINVEAGKTYFLSFDIASGLTFKMKYRLRDADVGMRQITNCSLAQCLETNLVSK